MPPFLKKDIGGIPMWAWILVGAAGIGIGFFILKKQKAAADQTPTEDNTTPGTTSVQGGNAPQTVTNVYYEAPDQPRGPTQPVSDQHVCPAGQHWDPNAPGKGGIQNGVAILASKGACVPDVESPPDQPGPIRKPPPVTHPSRSYTIVSGDTLSRISTFVKIPVASLYSMNKDVIEKAAKAHGKSSSENGRFIYPGTVLKY